MAKRRRKGRRPSPAASHGARATSTPAPVTLPQKTVIFLLGAVLLATALAVDPAAHAAFDAPKRLAALAGVAIAAVLASAFAAGSGSAAAWWRGLSRPARIALVAAGAGLLWAGLSAVLSPRRTASLDSMRAILVYAALLPLGASTAVARARTPLFAVFLSAAAVNSGISLLQSRGIRIFRLETVGSRDEIGALAGNVGYLATTLALAAVASLGIVIVARRPGLRAVAGAALLLFLIALLLTRNLTSLLATLGGAVALVVVLRGRRSVVPIAIAAGALTLGALAYAPARARIFEAARAARAGDWDRLTTYRGGAWAAALAMARERPLVGWGPGTYGAEFVPHRLEAEIRAGRRFVNPLVTSSYSEAHCDYLQAFAETGVPGGLAALAAAGALLVALGRQATRPGESRVEAAVLFGVLLAGAVAALTWFPLQRPISAVPMLLAAGRGWRLVAERAETAFQ